MTWQKFKGQKLHPNDIVWCKKDGFACVTDVGLQAFDGTWTFDFDVKDDNPKAGLHHNGNLIDIKGNKVDRVTHFMRIKPPRK